MIAIGSDHGGFDLKEILLTYLKEKGYDVKDFGCYDKESVDYPDIAHKVCLSITDGQCELGVLVCTTGIGMSMCANKHKGIRAAQCADPHSAKMTRKHNDANVITLGGEIIEPELAKQIIDAFLNSEFEGGRHQRRVEKMMKFEN